MEGTAEETGRHTWWKLSDVSVITEKSRALGGGGDSHIPQNPPF